MLGTKGQTKDREIDKLKIFLLLSKSVDENICTVEKDCISGYVFLFWEKKNYVPLCVFLSKSLVIANRKHQLFYLQNYLLLPKSQHPEQMAKLTCKTKQYVKIQLQRE